MDLKRLTMTEWAEEDRPREKLLNNGAATLSDAELLAILIASGNKNETAVELSRRILNYYDNNLDTLGRCTIEELVAKFNGIGEAKAITILAAMELGRRQVRTSVVTDKVTCSRDVYNQFFSFLSNLTYEEFWLLLMNQSNRIIGKVKLSQGGIAGTLVDARLAIKAAIDRLAVNVALCHNHPSGNRCPSKQDEDITQKLKTAFAALDIRVLDHIIIAGNKYYSFADEGVL